MELLANTPNISRRHAKSAMHYRVQTLRTLQTKTILKYRAVAESSTIQTGLKGGSSAAETSPDLTQSSTSLPDT